MKNLRDYLNEGYCGYTWIESDSCADLLANVFNGFNKVLEDEIDKYVSSRKNKFDTSLACFDAANAMLYIFDLWVKNNREYCLTNNLCDLCITCLNMAKQDIEMQHSWDNPEEFVNHLNTMMNKAENFKNISEKNNK